MVEFDIHSIFASHQIQGMRKFFKTSLFIELILLQIITTGVFYTYYLLQPVVEYRQCARCDGNQYLQIYQYFQGKIDTLTLNYPFQNRPFVPFLASLLPLDALPSFRIINFIFSLLAVNSLYFLWKTLEIKLIWRCLGIFWLLFHWIGLIRLNAYDCLTVDVPLYFFQTALIWIFLTKQFGWLWLLVPMATLQKESFLALGIVSIFVGLFNQEESNQATKLKIIVGSVGLGILANWVSNYFLPAISPANNFLYTIWIHIYILLGNPFRLLQWLAAIFTAFGAFSFVWFRRKNFILLQNQPVYSYLSVWGFTYLLFGLLAGGDSTRIVFLGFPFLMTLLLLLWQQETWWKSAVAFLLSLPILHLINRMPDQTKNWQAFSAWYPEFAEAGTLGLWAIYGLLCYIMIKELLAEN
jgi:hypothetical protein